jgi:hypothetical protein
MVIPFPRRDLSFVEIRNWMRWLHTCQCYWYCPRLGNFVGTLYWTTVTFVWRIRAFWAEVTLGIEALINQRTTPTLRAVIDIFVCLVRNPELRWSSAFLLIYQNPVEKCLFRLWIVTC